jgi:hypothetical protein
MGKERVIVEVHDLEEPIELGKMRAESLEFRKARAGDLCDLSDDKVTQILQVAARLTGHPEGLLKQMSLPDLRAVEAIVVGFLDLGSEPATGNAGSPE